MASENISREDLHVIPAIIGGKDLHLPSTFDVMCPSTGEIIHRSSSASEGDARLAVDAAHAALVDWKTTTISQRRNILLRAADIFNKRATELANYLINETGATEAWAGGFNVPVTVELLRDVAGRLTSMTGIIPQTQERSMSALVYKEPYGVILGIAPWNAAYILGVRAIAYAIAAGNTAILKGSELSPRCFWAIGDCFREAGLPAGVLSVIVHRPSDAASVTKALIEDPRVKKINFTGSTAVGRIISEMAGRNLKPVLLELGGKAPAIVWKDANLELAAAECAKGAFLHTGQICMSTERIIVHRSVAGEFESTLKKVIAEVFPQPGVLINGNALAKNKKLLHDATAKGAELVYISDPATITEGATRMGNVVIKNVTPQMDLYYTESFGSSVSLFVVDTEEEAFRLANDTEYGLTSAVFTEDLRTGLRFAKGIEAAACHLNGMTVHDEPGLPHGGFKNSGFGRFGAVGLDEWLQTKTVTFKN